MVVVRACRLLITVGKLALFKTLNFRWSLEIEFSLRTLGKHDFLSVLCSRTNIPRKTHSEGCTGLWHSWISWLFLVRICRENDVESPLPHPPASPPGSAAMAFVF